MVLRRPWSPLVYRTPQRKTARICQRCSAPPDTEWISISPQMRFKPRRSHRGTEREIYSTPPPYWKAAGSVQAPLPHRKWPWLYTLPHAIPRLQVLSFTFQQEIRFVEGRRQKSKLLEMLWLGSQNVWSSGTLFGEAPLSLTSG